MSQRVTWLFGLAALAACNNDGIPDDAVSLDWRQGDLFYVGATYRVANVKTVENPTDLNDPSADFGEHWSSELFWTYQVVETGLVPDASDELHDYALQSDGRVASLSVVRAWLDASLNPEEELLESDPVIYLVFREDRDRLAAIISFTDVDGDRVERAWSTKDLGKSWSALSQSMLTAAPTYLAPFSTRFASESKVLENGSLLDSELVDDGVVDVFYDDELGGGLVFSRYEAGQPWPTHTASDNVVARLLSESDIEARRATLPFFPPTEPDDFDFRAGLRSSVDIEKAMVLDAETMAGGFSAHVREGYRPWAGNWWPLRKAGLVFGYRNGGPNADDTFSDQIYPVVQPIKKQVEILGDQLRDMPEGSEKQAKLAEYQQKQSDLVDELVGFYGGILQGLRGGTITVSDGQITKSGTGGWSYPLNSLSPMDKWALVLYLDGQTNPNPFYLGAWELLNSWAANEAGDNSWWGHCNGWAAAAILENEPKTSETITVGGHSFAFSTADLKGLTTEAHYSTYSRFYGSRYYKEGDDIADLTPAAFHRLITFYFREQGVPLVFDTTADAPVWNFPAWGADVTVTETTPASADAGKVNINTADAATLDTLPGIGPSTAAKIITYREANGPFQAIEDIQKVSGIGASTFGKFKDQITVSVATNERTFDVVARVKFTTDGVTEDYVEATATPQGFTNTYRYTLTTDEKGRLTSAGTWDNDREHPDFAWVPYENPLGTASNNSENPYLVYRDFTKKLSDRRR